MSNDSKIFKQSGGRNEKLRLSLVIIWFVVFENAVYFSLSFLQWFSFFK